MRCARQLSPTRAVALSKPPRAPELSFSSVPQRQVALLLAQPHHGSRPTKASRQLNNPQHSPLAPFTVGRATSWGAMVWGREVEVTGWAAEVQDGAAGSREGVEGGGERRAELLWVVPRIILGDDLLQAEGRQRGTGSGSRHPTRTFCVGNG